MSGHNKWSTIKHTKGKNDAAMSKIFSKIGKEIAVAVKLGGPDPNINSKLYDVIQKAKQNNMPNDNIQRSIKKAAGEQDGDNYSPIVYEGYGINGVAVIVNASTNNKNRTAADVRHIFDKFGGNLGTPGCVSYMFEKKGVIVIEKEECPMQEDDLMMLAIEAGAEDFSAEEEVYEITTAPADFTAVTETLTNNGLKFLEAGVQQVPSTYIALDEVSGEKMQKLIDNLDDLDDVLEVFHNWEE